MGSKHIIYEISCMIHASSCEQIMLFGEEFYTDHETTAQRMIADNWAGRIICATYSLINAFLYSILWTYVCKEIKFLVMFETNYEIVFTPVSTP